MVIRIVTYIRVITAEKSGSSIHEEAKSLENLLGREIYKEIKYKPFVLFLDEVLKKLR
jgi:hypothetical protein